MPEPPVSARRALGALSVVLLGALAAGAQETEKTAPKKTSRADVIARGYAALEGIADVCRVVATPNTGERLLMVAEYEDGSVALFEKGDGAKDIDHTILVDAVNQQLLLEALLRAKSRQDWKFRSH
jgi:hypothetical protein